MTPDEKQVYLRRVLPEIARACFKDSPTERKFSGVKVLETDEYPSGVCAQIYRGHPYHWIQHFAPQDDDRDSAYMRRVMRVGVEYHSGNFVETWIYGHILSYITEPHDGTPDSMGEAERWAAIQTAAKKLGLE